MFKHKCGLENHKFEARYSSLPPEDVGQIQTSVYGALKFMEAMTRKQYECDVCIYCGKIVKSEAK